MLLRCCIALVVMIATLVPAFAQEQVKIGIGYGLAFLPVYLCQDLKLIEKYAKAAHLDVKASFPRLIGAAQVQSAIASGAIDIGPFGTAPLLAAWEKAKDTPQQILAVSGITSLPLVLLSNQPDEQSIADLKPSDRIAVPTLTSPQMELLELQSEKIFGQYDRLRGSGDRVAACGGGRCAGRVIRAKKKASRPPIFRLRRSRSSRMRDANVHPILKSADVMGGKFSFLVLGATRAYIERATANARGRRQGDG